MGITEYIRNAAGPCCTEHGLYCKGRAVLVMTRRIFMWEQEDSLVYVNGEQSSEIRAELRGLKERNPWIGNSDNMHRHEPDKILYAMEMRDLRVGWTQKFRHCTLICRGLSTVVETENMAEQRINSIWYRFTKHELHWLSDKAQLISCYFSYIFVVYFSVLVSLAERSVINVKFNGRLSEKWRRALVHTVHRKLVTCYNIGINI
jgi:hypothetical protein